MIDAVTVTITVCGDASGQVEPPAKPPLKTGAVDGLSGCNDLFSLASTAERCGAQRQALMADELIAQAMLDQPSFETAILALIEMSRPSGSPSSSAGVMMISSR